MSYQPYHQPQYHQSTATPAMEWNGSAWVPFSRSSDASQHQQAQNNLYSQHSFQFASAPSQPPPSAKSPVEVYTEYYYGWQAAMKHYERLPPPERDQQVGWARYYAEQSSRAAHHYNQNPDVTPSFALPPAPPPLARSSSSPASISESPGPSSHHSDDKPTTSLTSYVKRCLDQCSTLEERKQVQAKVEQRIARAIQENNLHTKDWSQEPLIPVLGVRPAAAPQASSSRPHQDQTPASAVMAQHTSMSTPATKYYGPGAMARSSRDYNYPSSSTTNSGLHYGPSAHNSTHPSFIASSSTSSTSYYGPASPSTSAGPSASASPSAVSQQIAPRKFKNVKYSQKRQSLGDNYSDGAPDDGMDRSSRALSKRQARFFAGADNVAPKENGWSNDQQDYSKYMGLATINGNTGGGVKLSLTDDDFERMTVKGVCQTLEKDYLRLTAPPRPEMVRPEPILRKHLQNLLSSDNTNSGMYASRDYLWMCSQYKALRQDLTIQRISNDLAVDVYEAHARLALREGDLNEFNQCQTQLPDLYEANPKVGARDEFRAYRLLYHVYLITTITKEQAAATSEITKSLAIANPGPSLQHALDIRRSIAHHEYATFFRLHFQSPHLGKYLTERMVPIMRYRALTMIIKAYRPRLELDCCQTILGFVGGAQERDPQQQQKECQDFLEACGAKVENATTHRMLLTKESDGQIHEPTSTEVPNSLLR